MFLSSTIGGLAGLADYNRQVYPVEYRATATVAIEDPKALLPEVLIQVRTGRESDAREAIDSAGLMINGIGSYRQSLVTIRELAIEENVDGGGWWKATALGAGIVTLLAIGGIYVWGDVLAYHRRQPTFPQPDF